MNKIKCTLCDHTATLLGTTSKTLLQTLWQRDYAIDVDTMLAGDLNYYHCGNCSLRFWDHPVKNYAALYSQLSVNEWYYPRDREEFTIAQPYTVGTVLEIGAGAGYFAKYCAGHYTGIDHNENLDRNVYNWDIENITEQFDTVVSFHCLEHIQTPRLWLQQLIRLCKPLGTIIIAVPNDSSWIGRAQHMALNLPPHHWTRWDNHAQRSIAAVLGLVLEHRITTQPRLDLAPKALDYFSNDGDAVVLVLRKPK